MILHDTRYCEEMHLPYFSYFRSSASISYRLREKYSPLPLPSLLRITLHCYEKVPRLTSLDTHTSSIYQSSFRPGSVFFSLPAERSSCSSLARAANISLRQNLEGHSSKVRHSPLTHIVHYFCSELCLFSCWRLQISLSLKTTHTQYFS